MVDLDRRSLFKLAGFAGGTAALGSSPRVDKPRVPFAHLPTPLEELPWLSAELGPRILVKRDDQTGLATGGNKARKLEYLVAAALAEGADTLITRGGLQSNHCRQTAAAAARCGLRCVLLLSGEKDEVTLGNRLLDELLGAEVHVGESDLEAAAKRERDRGHKPYVIPTGGSNAVGATAYVAAYDELRTQLKVLDVTPDWIIVASGSCGTQGGLAVGVRAAGDAVRLLGIAVSSAARILKPRLASIATATAAHLDYDFEFKQDDFAVNSDFLGGGYGVIGPIERRAIRTAASTEGLLLDPVYTGRAFGGMLELIESKAIARDDVVVFWHTGGTPALFVPKYSKALV